MKREAQSRFVVAVFLIIACCVSACAENGGYEPREGDIVFHTSRSSQSLAIQLATKSPYSHMGIVYFDNGKPYVYEAIQPVKATPLTEWTQRGVGRRYVAKRLVKADLVLTTETLAKMRRVGETMKGKDYDLYFEWSDDRIYCSELVWKMYKYGADIEIGALENIDSFDLTHEKVQAKILERYPNGIPAGEMVISPAAMFHSTSLEIVFERG